jgi:hypothetical protein
MARSIKSGRPGDDVTRVLKAESVSIVRYSSFDPFLSDLLTILDHSNIYEILKPLKVPHQGFRLDFLPKIGYGKRISKLP